MPVTMTRPRQLRKLDGLGEIVDEIAGKRGFKRAQALGLELQGARGRSDRFAAVVAQQAIPLKRPS